MHACLSVTPWSDMTEEETWLDIVSRNYVSSIERSKGAVRLDGSRANPITRTEKHFITFTHIQELESKP
jgi:hypothetical protein